MTYIHLQPTVYVPLHEANTITAGPGDRSTVVGWSRDAMHELLLVHQVRVEQNLANELGFRDVSALAAFVSEFKVR